MSRVTYIQSYEIPDSWKYAEKKWGIALHRMMSRTGSFPPALAHWFVAKYSDRGDVVLDPFCGKGTLPLEACLLDRIGLGNDLAPEAYVVSRAKVNPVSLGEVRKWVEEATRKMRPDAVSIYDADEDVRVFFSPSTLKQILAVRELLLHDDSDVGNFIKAVMLGILHGPSELHLSLPCSHSFSMSPGYLKRYAKRHRLRRPNRNVLSCILRRAENLLADGVPRRRGRVFMRDARSLPLPDSSVDLIVTSPPYFNMQTYAWDNWLRLWFLGYNYEEVRRKLFETQSIPKFVAFMRKCFDEMFRVLKDDSACIVVVGDVKINGRLIDMARLLMEPAEASGFTVAAVISDNIPKEHKYLMYVDEGKGVSREKILILHKGNVRIRDSPVAWSGVVSVEVDRP